VQYCSLVWLKALIPRQLPRSRAEDFDGLGLAQSRSYEIRVSALPGRKRKCDAALPVPPACLTDGKAGCAAFPNPLPECGGIYTERPE